MRVKIFRAVGMDDVGQLEDRVNGYLDALGQEGQKVTQVTSTIAPIGDAQNGGTDMYAVFAIWYEPDDKVL